MKQSPGSIAACHGFTRASAASIAWRRRAWASSSVSKNSTFMAITSFMPCEGLFQLRGVHRRLERLDRCVARRAGLCAKF
jgi:hypothetical protein